MNGVRAMVIFAVLVILAVAASVGAFVVIMRRRHPDPSPAAEKPAASTPHQAVTAVAGFYDDATIEGDACVRFEHRGMGYEAKVTPGKSPIFKLALTSGGGDYPAEFTPTDDQRWERRYTVRHQPQIALSWERRGHRVGERLGITRRLGVGDAAFDRQIHIATEAPAELVSDALRQVEAREAALELLKAGFDRVTLFDPDGPVVATAFGRPPSSTLSHKGHSHHVHALRTLGRALPPIQVERPGVLPLDVGGWLTAGYLLMAIFGFLLLALGYNAWPAFGRLPELTGATWSGLLWLLTLPGLVLVFRGRANAFHNLLACVALSACGYLVALPVGLKAANILLDRSNARQERVRVVHTDTNKDRTSHYLEIEPDPDLGPPTRLEVSSGVYYGCSRGDRLRLTVRDGGLGWAWVRKVHGCR